MMKSISAALIMMLGSTAAMAQGSTAAGAVGGAAVGAVVGGPVGAVVGGTVGAVAGAIAEPPREVITYVERERPSGSVVVREEVVVGRPLPSTVVVRPVPSHGQWGYAIVNDRRVIVDTGTRHVVRVIQ